MPIYEIEANGKTYEVEAPSPEAAASAIRGQSGGFDPGRFDLQTRAGINPEGQSDYNAKSQAMRMEAKRAYQQGDQGGVGAYARTALGGAIKAIPFGGDAVAALAAATAPDGRSFGDRYQEKLATFRGMTDADSEARPLTSAGSQIGTAVAALPTLGLAGAGYKGAAALGAIYGAAGGASEGDDISDRAEKALKGAAIGAPLGVAGEAVARGASKALGIGTPKPLVPAFDDIAKAKTAAYDKAEAAGVIFTPTAMQRLRANVEAKLADFGFDPKLQPGAAAVLSRLDDVQGQNVTLKGLDTIRKVAGNGYQPMNKANNAAVRAIIDEIDDVIMKPGAADILAGNAKAAGAALKEARSLALRQRKLDDLAFHLSKAENSAASSGSGGNVHNRIQQEVRKILETPRKSRGLTADEKAAIQAIVKPSAAQNAVRLAGKISPIGNGLSAMLNAGAAMSTGGLSLVGTAAGAMAKAASDAGMRAKAADLETLMRAGGSRAAVEAPKNAAQLMVEANRTRLLKGLLSAGVPAIGEALPQI